MNIPDPKKGNNKKPIQPDNALDGSKYTLKAIVNLRNEIDTDLENLESLNTDIKFSNDVQKSASSSNVATQLSKSTRKQLYALGAGCLLAGLIIGSLASINPIPNKQSNSLTATNEDQRHSAKPLANQGTEEQIKVTSREVSGKWRACVEEDQIDVEPPMPGETWWPVVGPSNSLEDAKRLCRADAFINRSGNAQISSFRDRTVAQKFAQELSTDNSHPWQFWVGEASVR